MDSIILPIRPKYVSRILNGSKRFEFRKKKCKEEIEIIYIYETAPTKMVVGEIRIDEILEGTPEQIWNQCEEYSGIDKKDYYTYFENCKKAIAYKIGEVKKYEIPKLLKEYGVNYAPQSFIYIK